MKKLTMLLAVATTLIISACNNSATNSEKNGSGKTVIDSSMKEKSSFPAMDTTKMSNGVTFYQCPMHAEITSDKPGECSKCGMKLELRTK